MKNKILLLLAAILFSYFASAQNIAINNNAASPDASAILDVNSSTKGLLIPRIALSSLTDASTIPTPATGLLIFNTNTAVTTGAGFYYNSGSTASPLWIKMATTADNVWRQQTDFVELVPAKPIYLQTNIGMGISTPLEKLHIADGNIKLGNSIWTAGNDRMLKFGDGDYVLLGEAGEDDVMLLNAKHFLFKNSSGYTGNVGIGTAGAPTAKLEVNGSFKLTNGSQGSGKMLTSDATGNANWVTPVSNTNFRAISSGAQFFAPNTTTTFNSFLDDYDVNNDFFGGIFHAPATGAYHFDAKVEIGINAANLSGYFRFYLSLFKNGIQLEENYFHVPNNTNTTFIHTITINENVQLLAGDQISLHVYSVANPGAGTFAANKVVFSGFRIY